MKNFTFLFYSITLIILSGCSNKLVIEPVGDSQLRIEVEGINLAADMSPVAKAITATHGLQTTTAVSAQQTRSVDPRNQGGFKVDFASTHDYMESSSELESTAGLSSRSSSTRGTISRNATPMQVGYKYRILLYNKATGQLWRTIQATSGSPASMEIQTGVTYSWYAYSYNSADDLPAPQNLNNPNIATAIDKDFLYASGEINVNRTEKDQESESLKIIFDHKVTQVRVRADATPLSRFAKIHNINVSFDRNNYLKKGVFSLKDNRISQVEVVPTETIFSGASSTNIWEKSYYTVDPQAVSSYKIIINDLPVTFNDTNPQMANRNLATYFGTANRPNFQYDFENPDIGQRLTSTANLIYELPSLRILHISNDTRFGYALQEGPSWDMLNSPENFGNLPESVVQMASWSNGQGVWTGGNANDNKSENWIRYTASASGDAEIVNRLVATNTVNRPDIVIIGYNVRSIRPAIATALINYMNDKGVVILMLQEATDRNTIDFFNSFFGVSNIGFDSHGSSGSMYPMEGNNPNDVILNGDFGDVRGRHWGEDAGTTLGMLNVPTNQVTIYSRGNAINRADRADRVTMFKHNTKSFFFIGDGGFVSYNGRNSPVICPFNYDPIAKKPLPKPFGDSGRGYTRQSLEAYNSIIIANVMAWAARKAELDGIREWRYAGPPRP